MPNKPIPDEKMIPVERLHGAAMPGIIESAKSALLGRTVERVGYMSLGGDAYPAIFFTDGTNVIAQCDDECNGPGALSIVTAKGKETILCETTITS
jgi:hypothetical protein